MDRAARRLASLFGMSALAVLLADPAATSPYLLMVRALQLDSDQTAAAAQIPLRPVVTREDLDDDDRPTTAPIESDDPEKDEIEVSLQWLFQPGRYRYEYRGLSALADAAVVVIGFAPEAAANQPQPAAGASRTQRLLQDVLNHSIGEIYLDQRTGGIVRWESHLTQTVGYLTARVYLTDITYEQQAQNGIWLPRRAVIYLRYSYFFGIGATHRRFVVTYVPAAPE